MRQNFTPLIIVVAVFNISCTEDNRPSQGFVESPSQKDKSTFSSAVDTIEIGKPHFDYGIGFYYYSEGIATPLFFPNLIIPKGSPGSKPENQISEKDIKLIPPDNRIFSYGLDFSQSGLGGVVTPPHVAGYQWGYMDNEGKLQGNWAVFFVPIGGYDQPVYEIGFAGPIRDLIEEKVEYDFIAFYVPHPHAGNLLMGGGPTAYVAHYATSKFKKEREEREVFLHQALSKNDLIYRSELIFHPAFSEDIVHHCEVTFSSFDEKTGVFTARIASVDPIPSGYNPKSINDRTGVFKGEIIDSRQLILYQEKSGIRWNLVLNDQKTLEGTERSDVFVREVFLRVFLDTEESLDIGKSPDNEKLSANEAPSSTENSITQKVALAQGNLRTFVTALFDYNTSLISSNQEGAFPPTCDIESLVREGQSGTCNMNSHGILLGKEPSVVIKNGVDPQTGKKYKVNAPPRKILDSLIMDPFSQDSKSPIYYYCANPNDSFFVWSVGPDGVSDVKTTDDAIRVLKGEGDDFAYSPTNGVTSSGDLLRNMY